MITINWEEFKIFKQSSHKKDDNFEVLLDFLKSFYNMTNPREMFETMMEDELASRMLDKREMYSALTLAEHLYKNFHEH